MPGLLGGVAAAVASVVAYHPNKALFAHGHHQWGYQLLAVLVTLGAHPTRALSPTIDIMDFTMQAGDDA